MPQYLSPESLSLAQQLIRINTVSRNSNLPLIDLAADYLRALGVDVRLTFNADKTKANLFATVGAGKSAGLILSGHTDTVPWDGQDWTLDPLGAVVKEGKLYGRGSADMKGFIACALSQAKLYLEADLPYAIHYALSYDEEVGCFGARELIADMKDAGMAPLACIVGEPTSMVPAIAHKGVYRWRCCVRGKEAHSSLTPTSVNAIEEAAKIVSLIRGMADEWKISEPHYEGFDVPFSTASVGQFQGGIADNVVPRDAWFHYEFRDLPTADVALMQKRVQDAANTAQSAMKNIAIDAGFTFSEICAVPSFLGSDHLAVTKIAKQLSGEEKSTLVAFGTEAGLFKQAGMDTVVCGPGSINQAHQSDEFVSLEQLARCEAFLQGLATPQQLQ